DAGWLLNQAAANYSSRHGAQAGRCRKTSATRMGGTMRSAARAAGWPAMPRPRGTGPEVTVPGGPPGAARAPGGITLGVEEEFVLLNPSTGAAVLAGPVLARMLDGEPGVQQEVMRFQVETATQVCTSLDDLGRDLVRLRRLAAGAAASAGCLLVASGIAPY